MFLEPFEHWSLDLETKINCQQRKNFKLSYQRKHKIYKFYDSHHLEINFQKLEANRKSGECQFSRKKGYGTGRKILGIR